PAQRASPATTPGATGGSKLEAWIGFPTLSESAHPNYPFWTPTAVDTPFPPTVNLTIDTAIGELAAYPSIGQRAGEDVLLRDVLSIDVKVLEDIGGYSGLLPDGSDDGSGLALQASGAGGETEYHDLRPRGGLYCTPA